MRGLYYAFVESTDALDGKRLDDRAGLPEYWPGILTRRREASLYEPTHRVWLDCVRRDYFLDLDWRTEPCERNNIEHANKRRRQLLGMDPHQLATVLLLTHREDEDGAMEPLQEGSWHRIELGSFHGLPVVVAPDFDLIAAQEHYLRWYGEVTQLERDWLANVFNVDFVPDAQWGDRGGPTPPPYPQAPSKDAGFTYPIHQPLRS
ncbi:MAG TPA: hypothetical protein VME63_17245 [Dyella sp.]|uniref:hypothetical protein n=1 Tax=Dyella sp. TaxID=1869338 RepID=UPI002C0CD035|nr:hypothetical protein [Dyella sp.]HTV87148.1 hypothetical protein [Dyella sp.]